MKKYLFLGLLLAFGQGIVLAESSTQAFANLILLLHDCGNGGEIEYELVGEPNLYSYYWEYEGSANPVPDLPHDLHLTGLPPGKYTLTVRDFYGCEESYEVEILLVDSCYAILTRFPGNKKCTFDITIQVYNETTGDPYDLTIFTIEWLDDPDAGFTRTVSQYAFDYEYTYIITTIGGDETSCCYIEDSFTIPGDKETCNYVLEKEAKIIVNEFDGTDNKRGQFIELLVLGNKECGAVTNIGGFIIDDNNGLLIPGNYLIQSTSYQQLGIDEGHLMFQYHKNWEEVPNGSLIVIYQDSLSLDSLSLTDDPTDENEDGVYVLSADNAEYIYGKTGNWNNDERLLDYGGTFVFPSWQAINLSDPADGIQVRNPDKVLSHGISTGESLYASNELEFEMKLGSGNASAANCQFMLTDYFNKEHFICYFDEGVSATPGLPNSPENDSIIFALIHCDSIKELSAPINGNIDGGLVSSDSKKDDEIIRIYPNPFNGNFTLTFNALEKGIAKLALYSISGELVFTNDILSITGENKTQVTPGGLFPAGIYFIQFTFPSGVILREYVIHIRD